MSDLIEHLDNVSNEIQKSAKSTSPQIETYKRDMDYHESEMNKYKKEQEGHKKESKNN